MDGQAVVGAEDEEDGAVEAVGEVERGEGGRVEAAGQRLQPEVLAFASEMRFTFRKLVRSFILTFQSAFTIIIRGTDSSAPYASSNTQEH